IALHDATRPLVNLSYAVDRAIWGPAPRGFHVTSVLLHMLNVALLFALALRLTTDRYSSTTNSERTTNPESTKRDEASNVERTTFVTAVLFAVHPLMTEAVGYVSGRSEVLCAAFFLTGFLTARRWMLGGGAIWWVSAIAS